MPTTPLSTRCRAAELMGMFRDYTGETHNQRLMHEFGHWIYKIALSSYALKFGSILDPFYFTLSDVLPQTAENLEIQNVNLALLSPPVHRMLKLVSSEPKVRRCVIVDGDRFEGALDSDINAMYKLDIFFERIGQTLRIAKGISVPNYGDLRLAYARQPVYPDDTGPWDEQQFIDLPDNHIAGFLREMSMIVQYMTKQELPQSLVTAEQLSMQLLQMGQQAEATDQPKELRTGGFGYGALRG